MKSITATLIIILIFSLSVNAQLDFQALKTIPNLGQGTEVNLADLDGDGDQDIIISTQTNPVIFAYFNHAGIISSVPIPITPAFMGDTNAYYTIPFTIGDFDNDGKSELVGYDQTSATSTTRLSIYKFDGEKFVVAQKLTTPNENGIYQVVNGDFNKDGKLDILYVANKLYAYESNTSGGYTTKTISTPEIIPFKCFISDIDNDTWPDIIVYDFNFKISIYKNNKNGGFTFNQSLGATVPLIREIFVEDLNNDNLKDIVVQGFGQSFVELFSQNSNGTFTTSKINFDAITYGGLEVTDLNNDNRPDIIMGGQYDDPISRFGFIFLLNNGNGFNYSFYTEPSLFPLDMKVANLDSDSKKEIIGLNSGKNVLIYKYDQGQTIFNKNIPYAYISDKSIIKDLNKDGLDDIIVTNVHSNSLAVFYNKGDGTYEPPTYLLTDGPTYGVGSADFNNDSYPDILYSINFSSASNGIFLSDANGNLGSATPLPSSSGGTIVINDFNHDGNMDFFNGAQIFYGSGLGTFIDYSLGINNITSYTTGDYNQDGYGDLVIATLSGLTVLHGNNSYIMAFSQNVLTNKMVTTVSSGNLNSDLFLDLIVTYNDGSISQFNNSANETLTDKSISISGNASRAITADFNKDTYPDLAILVNNDRIVILSGSANGEFEFYKDYLTSPYAYNQLHLANINADTFDDIVLLESGNHPIGLLLNDLVVEPIQSPGNLLINSLSDKTVTLSLTSGNGNGRLVLIREQSNPASLPLDNSFYNANSKYGSGSKLGTDNFVVLAENKMELDITDLKENTTYTINAFEYTSNSKKTLINYLTTSSGSVTFKTKKSQVINPPSIAAKTLGDPSFNLSVTTSSGLPASIEVISGGATVSNTTITMSNPGPVKLKITQVGDGDYATAPAVEITFCVNPVLPTVTYAASNGKFTLTSSSVSNNFWLKNNILISEETNQTIEVSPDGAYSVKVDYAGCYNTSATVSNQIISFPQIEAKEEGQPDFVINATSSSLLDVSFEVLSGGLTVNQADAKINSSGPVKIKAIQSGNSNFFPALAIEQTFCINPKKPTITSINTEPGKYILSSSSEINNRWFRNDNLITGAVNKTHEPDQDGVYSVKVDYSGCFNISLPTINLITGIEKIFKWSSLYPNPASDQVFIDWPKQNPEIKQIIILNSQGKQIVARYNHNEGLIAVDIQELAPGFFIIILETSTGPFANKIIKK